MGDQVWRALSRFHLDVFFVSVLTFLAQWFYSVLDSQLGARSFSDPCIPELLGLPSSKKKIGSVPGHLSLPDPPVAAISVRR